MICEMILALVAAATTVPAVAFIGLGNSIILSLSLLLAILGFSSCVEFIILNELTDFYSMASVVIA
ncbi:MULTISPECIES: hypothetical protein [Candidatus Ichthyocystis]|uniref:hypothetical protein n=1 Tax=Candidatus Ichthyocystis TaxID=2929841 RepID=UPI000B87B930|nr:MULTISPECIES: hypothetical protein [Ichthyocystis]